MITIFDIHKKLGLNLENGLFIRKVRSISNTNIEDLYDGNFSAYKSDFKVEYALKKLQPHSFFLFNNQPLLLFFESKDLKGTDEKSPEQILSEKIWNFNKSALAFVNFKSELLIYNGFNFDKKSNLLSVLETIKKIEDLSNMYSYWQIVTAELWNAKDEEFKKKTRVDTKLLENIKATREILIDSKLSNKLSEKHANRIIGRLIFVRYLIDRNVNLDYKGKGKELLTKTDLPKLILQKDNLFDFFDYLLRKFKGNILPLNGERDTINDFHLIVLSNLFAGTTIKAKQQSLFNIFDFDFIPIELISNIYETFLGEKQESDKAFYTPPFLVEYILEQTVKPFVETQITADKLVCKTVDFTCGSGIFLCETLRTIINRYIILAKPDRSSNDFKNKITQILVDNIFGNDINVEAIEIAKFSLFITLLDYFEDPKDIENFIFPDVSNNFFSYDIFDTELNSDNNFVSQLDNIFGKGKKIEPDFIIGNPPWGTVKESKYVEHYILDDKTFISLEELEKAIDFIDILRYLKDKVFISKNEFVAELKKICKENELVKEIVNKSKREGYTKKRALKEKIKNTDTLISNNEFSQAFLLRLSDFSTKNTVCHIIVTSKLLYNLQADKFRNYFLNNFLINEVLEISSVRHQIFSNAVGPAAIIKYQYAFGNDTQANKIDYVSLKPNPYFAIFKSILIEKYDYKEVIQKELIKNDWLWKVLVYGHILDYRFIERLRDKNKFPVTLGDMIENKDNPDRPLSASVGIKVYQKGKEADASHLKGLHFIQVDSKKTKRTPDLQRYYIRLSEKSIWNNDTVAEIRSEKYFTQCPILLIKRGLSVEFELISSIAYIPVVFTEGIYSIISKKQNHLQECLLALFNSLLFKFYLLTNGSSLGVEREQIIFEELLNFPILESNYISVKAKNLIDINEKIKIKHTLIDNKRISEFENQFLQTESELNKLIFDLYKLSNTERDLISYSQEITIPILQAKNKYFREIKQNHRLYKPYKDIEKSEIEDYINIFKEHFKKLHNSGERGYFNVKIIQSKSVLACEFTVDKEKREDIWQDMESNDKALELLVSLGFQKISNGLFIQKDIKVLKRKSFSVAKPKQYKYWHKAIARLDVVEFMESMIESQKQNANAKS